MIVRPHLHWFRMLLAWRGSVLPQLLPRLFLVLGVSIIAVAAHDHIIKFTVNLSTVPFSLIGIALAVFLGFRNSASYDRYWEGRKLWGQLLNESRSLTRQALTLTNGSDDSHKRARELVNLLCALPHALRHQLRQTDPRDDLANHLPPALLDRVMASRFRPATLLVCASEWMRNETRQGRLDGWAVLAFERNLNGLSDVIGGCERIASTPLPFAYTVMIHRTVYFFCATLPFGLVESIGPLTPIFAVFVAYAFMAHEAIASQIEDPFGTEDNDLALTAMSTQIEAALHDLLGDSTTLPVRSAEDFIID
ncbi:bestrophin family protein [Paraburkholderia adhaesiva]|uniref:bestrophin family protein n=1 Tax=Paraburkholderia adhaesiva TaxID=2883244 RepID=UPI001F363F52|nr:bestrophin family ion channel [Paraburkholderia adhaesiva]